MEPPGTPLGSAAGPALLAHLVAEVGVILRGGRDAGGRVSARWARRSADRAAGGPSAGARTGRAAAARTHQAR